MDPLLLAELRDILQVLRQVDAPAKALDLMMRPALHLLALLFAAAGQKPLNDNLNSRIDEAVKQRLLPDELATWLHPLRILSNKAHHMVGGAKLTHDDAELVLRSFLRVLRWHYCESAGGPLQGATDDRISAGQADQELASLDGIVADPRFIAWRNKILVKRHQPAVAKILAQFSAVSGLPTIAGHTYPIVTFPAAHPDQPFLHRQLGPPGLHQRETREPVRFGASGRAIAPQWVHENRDPELLRYFYLLARSQRVRRWNMPGYALSRLHVDSVGCVVGFDAESCTYVENCLTCHFVGHKLALDFQRFQVGAEHPDDVEMNAPPRFQFQPGDSDGNRWCIAPTAVSELVPLISVQAIVAFREPEDDNQWHVLTMKREGGVAVAAGQWQFPPAGGFEIYGHSDDGADQVEAQFDVRTALIREFFEEIFGDVDMACDSEDDAVGDHSGSRGYQHVVRAIRKGAIAVHFLGVVTELVWFRSEFSFVIFIDDPEFLALAYPVTIGGVVREARWMRGSREGHRLRAIRAKELGRMLGDRTWNPSSVGMLALLAAQSCDGIGWIRRKYADFPAIALDISL